MDGNNQNPQDQRGSPRYAYQPFDLITYQWLLWRPFPQSRDRNFIWDHETLKRAGAPQTDAMYNFLCAYFDGLTAEQQMQISPMDWNPQTGAYSLTKTARARRLWVSYRHSQQAVVDWGGLIRDIPEDHYGKIGPVALDRCLRADQLPVG